MRVSAVKDVKEEFLKTAFDYMVENGLENTSVRDLCKATGMSTGSVYYWFDGKDELCVSAAEYGLSKVTEQMFDFAFTNLQDIHAFLYSFLSEAKKHQSQLRLIYQVATSPVYGERLRNKNIALNAAYADYAEIIAKIVHKPIEQVAPLIYMFMSVVLDYVMWDDYDVALMQLDFLCELLIK